MEAQNQLQQEYLDPVEVGGQSEEGLPMELQEHPVVQAGKTSEEDNIPAHAGDEHHPYHSGEENDGIFYRHNSLQQQGH